MMIADLIENYAQEKTDASHNDSEIHAERKGNLERHEVSKNEGSCAMPKMPKIPETRRNILRL